MEYQEMKTNADTFRTNRQYEQALPLYQELWESDWDQEKEWVGWGYAFCLRKTGKPEQALEICRDVFKIKPDMERNRSLYAWCIYDTELKKDFDEIRNDEKVFFKAANVILELTPKVENYSPKVKAVFAVVNNLTDQKRNRYPGEDVLAWLDKLDPDQLSEECSKGPGKNNKQVEYPCDKEKWYSEKAKALQKLERYQESKDISLKALETFTNFHFDNDIWFNYRIARADQHLGLLSESMARFKEIIERKKDYFLYLEMADISHAEGDLDNAIELACRAALATGQNKLGYRWKVYFLLAKLFNEKDELELAKEHVLLCVKIRQEENWKIPDELQSLVDKFSIDLNEERKAIQIEKALQETWKKYLFQDKEKIRGSIIKINSNGNSGFIRDENGKEYFYSSRELRDNQEMFDYGIEVEFYCEPTSEKGKKDAAIEIYRVEM